MTTQQKLFQEGSKQRAPHASRASNGLSDLDLEQWKDHSDIETDSLWIIPERDKSGAHSGAYHGNFVPQIPHQAILRFTRAGDVVLDLFAGSGTTLIECRRLGRHAIGVELIAKHAELARRQSEVEPNPHDVRTEVIVGDSRNEETAALVSQSLRGVGRDRCQLVILHPPYHDIIKFTADPRDLCNAPTLESFLGSFEEVVKRAFHLLEFKRHLVLVIGDKYTKGEWVPLGFHCMERVLRSGFKLKSIVVKNMTGNRAKRNLEKLWRYRALAGGYYIFRHEYVMFFQKGTPQKG